jgi:hypothetical protein
MVDAMTLQTVISLLTLISLTIGVIYHIMTLRNTRRNQELTLKAQEQALETRQAQLFMQSYHETASVELQTLAFKIMDWEWTDYTDFREKYVNDRNRWGEFVSFMLHMNGLGILLEENYIHSELLYKMDQDGAAPMYWWSKFESVIREMRETENNPSLMKYFEHYAEEMIRLRKLNGLLSKYSVEQNMFIDE